MNASTPRSSTGAALATVAVLLLAQPSTAQAQDPAQAAQAAFQRGVTEMDAHRYQAALIALEESYRLHPSSVALYNLALAHRELGHTQQAIDTFERYLAEGGARVPAERVAAVRDTVRQLRAQLATVQLSVQPASFALTVDGRDASPANGLLTLDPGVHVLVATASGHRAWREEMRLAPAQREVRSVTLEREAANATPLRAQPPAAVAMTPHPPGASSAPVASPSITSRWWFWTGLGVLVAGGVVAGVVVANQSATPEAPLSGTAFDVQTIRTP